MRRFFEFSLEHEYTMAVADCADFIPEKTVQENRDKTNKNLTFCADFSRPYTLIIRFLP